MTEHIGPGDIRNLARLSRYQREMHQPWRPNVRVIRYVDNPYGFLPGKHVLDPLITKRAILRMMQV